MPKDDSAIYKRESIEELLTTHADAVSALRDAVADVLPTEVGLSSACQRLRPHLISFSYATFSPLILLFLRHLCQPVDGVEFDNLFLLRYILSFKTVAAAIEPCRTTLVWRIEQADVLHRLTLEGRAGIPNHSTFMKFQTVGDISTKFGGWPTYVVRTAHSDLPSLMNSLSVAEVRNFLPRMCSRAVCLPACSHIPFLLPSLLYNRSQTASTTRRSCSGVRAIA